ncbi:Uncharacterised protein [Pantoea agglomerans]|uniref:Uncharacterized protein n=1 Tax=Enterobacter agglomerans TaxID=549 RepID=A0A379AD53_ENTAG|nr:Uncharacterised protein [Pantoea agglomerans]
MTFSAMPEKSSDQVLSGTTTNVEAGQIVTITLGDQTYSAVVGCAGQLERHALACGTECAGSRFGGDFRGRHQPGWH